MIRGYDHWREFGFVPRSMTSAGRRHAPAPSKPVTGPRCEYCGMVGWMRAQRNARAACTLCDVWIGMELNKERTDK